MSRLPVIDSTGQNTHEWLSDIKARFGFDNDHAAYAASRAVLHALRHQLGTDQIAQLGAELPLLLRGVFYEGWNPVSSSAARREHNFIASVRKDLRENLELRNTDQIIRVVLGVIDLYLCRRRKRQNPSLSAPRGPRFLALRKIRNPVTPRAAMCAMVACG